MIVVLYALIALISWGFTRGLVTDTDRFDDGTCFMIGMFWPVTLLAIIIIAIYRVSHYAGEALREIWIAKHP